VLSLTPKGRNALKQRERIQLTRAVQATTHGIPRVGAIACDEALFERLRELREQLATERHLHPHTLFSDVTLRLLARDYPVTEAALAGISGMSDKKLREFGAALIGEIAGHLEKNPRQRFAANSFPVAQAGKPARKKASGKMGSEPPFDPDLFEKLRDVRKEIAKTRAVPAYVILHDSALRELTRVLPQSLDALADVHGVGPNRAAQFGEVILAAIRAHASGG
jgi:superfamily II DNA helicase RecQ